MPMKSVLSYIKPGIKIREFDRGQFVVFLLLLALLFVFILYPILRVLYVAFTQDGSLTLSHFLNFFQRDLFREALRNSLFAGLMAVIFGSLIALPLAFFTVKYDFKGKILIQSLGILPLVMPPFVGAIAMQLVLGRSGVINLLLLKWLGTTVPFMEGLRGVIIVQTLHYFPFILLNASASLKNVDPSLEEMAQNMGAHGLRLFRKITLPLMMPGYIAGALLVFIKTVDDLGTPLMLNYTNMLAPQAYLRITNIGFEDKAGYVIAVILVILSLASLWISLKYLNRVEYSTTQRGTTGASISKKITGWKLAIVLGFCILILTMSLLPHIGIALLSFAKLWSFTMLPAGYTLEHYGEVLIQTPHYARNTIAYCALAAVIDVGLGALIAFLLIRGKIIGKSLLDFIATLPLAIPGVTLAIGYLRVFHSYEIPLLGVPLTSTWFILVIAYSVRRLPYTLRSCYAAMQQIHESLEESAMNLGANRRRTFLKITLPLMKGGLVAGGLISFITSSVELSSTMMLVPKDEYGPLSYGIYVYMQSAVGRGPGACLGVVAIVIVAVGTYIVNKVFSDGSGTAFKV
ncbi:ABC transporter permease [Candidatus Poribacteria bacterium]